MILLAFLALLWAPPLCSSYELGQLTGCCYLLLLCNTGKPIEFSRVSITVMGWLAWAFVCAIYSQYPEQSFFGDTQTYQGLITWALIIFLGVTYWTKYDSLKPIGWAISIALVFITAVQLSYPPIYWPPMIGQPATLSSFAALAGTVLFNRKPALVLLAIPCVLLCQMRVGIAALVVGCATVWLVKHYQPKAL